MILEEFKNKVFKEAKNQNIDVFELYIEINENKSISCFDGKISDYSNSISENICFKCIIDKKIGIYSMNGLNIDNIENMIISAKNNSKFMENNNNLCLSSNTDNIYLCNTEEFKSFDELKKSILNLEKNIFEYNNLVSSIPVCKINQSKIITNVINSNSVNLLKSYQSSMAFIQCIINKNDKNYTFFEFEQNKNFDNLNFENLIKNVVENTTSQIGAIKVKSQNSNVIIRNDVFTEILEYFSPIFSAENAHNKLSLLENKENTLIANSKLNLIDSNISLDKSFYIPFDDDCEKTFKKYIIQNGILKTLLYNKEWSKKLNKDNTCNGFKNNYTSSVSISPCIFYIENGETELNDIFISINNGIFITQVSGLHSGINVVNGNASLDAKGFLIENGKQTTPIESFTISFNIYELLNNITDIANDLKFSCANKNSQFGSPSIAIKNVHIAGM